MKKWKLVAAVVCVCLLVTVAYAANSGGTSRDPLVTLSYLNDVFKPEVQQMVEDAVEDHQAELEEALNDLINSESGSAGAGGESASFTVVTLSRGQTLVGDVGCEVMLRVGSASCVSDDSTGLIDTTAGTVLGNGGALVTNHLYMVTISTRSVVAGADTVRLLVRGPYVIM